MKIITLAAILAACISVPALAQAQGEDHSAHHPTAATAAAPPAAAQPSCPMGMAMGGGSEGPMQHMAQMQQMMQMMEQMHAQMAGMRDQMAQMQKQMPQRRSR